MKHVVATAVTYDGLTIAGLVWCACGKRFDMWNEDALTAHIKEENSDPTQA